MIYAYYIDPQTQTAKAVEIDPDLDTYYEMLHCRCIDIANRRIGRKRYDIIVDDEGLLIGDPLISAIGCMGNPMLAGALLIVNHDEEGAMTSLTSNDLAYIARNITHMGTRKHPEGWPMLCNVEY